MSANAGDARPGILIVGLGSEHLPDVIAALEAGGWPIALGSPTDIAGRPWDLVISAPSLAGAGAIDLVAALGEPHAPKGGVLLIGREDEFASAGAAPPGVARLVLPFAPQQLVALVGDLIGRRAQRQAAAAAEPVAAHPLQVSDERAFLLAVEADLQDRANGFSAGRSFVAAVWLDEVQRHGDRLGQASRDVLLRQLVELVSLDAVAGETLALGQHGELLMLLPGLTRRQAMDRLSGLSRQLATHLFDMRGQFGQFSPVIGYADLGRARAAVQALAQAREAAAQSALHLDLHPALYKGPSAKGTKAPAAPSRLAQWWQAQRMRHALLIQYATTMVLGLGLPFLFYWGMDRVGLDISTSVYLFVVVTLALTALSIWAEGFLALRREDPPDEPAQPYPPASAIIAAYLPNEAPIIEATIEAFLRVQYPGSLQVILAYNTPRDMPEIEERLQRIAQANPRFIPMRIRTSTSKAQNVNAALPYATGRFTAVFDADHQPDPDSFRRAWRWLSHGADVVQGHCFIRNGDASWVARMVAIEFEQIYAVSHPGRARLHGFGIFGGSNGYWKSELLRELRMHGFMLTEDIDSSMRAVVRGRRIVSDPYLVSRELAPETLQALTKQRLRWAQGWVQISLKWVLPALRSPHLSVRQKLGMMQLLAWREAYPWVSMQILPLIAFWAVQAGSLWRIDWFVPLFVVTTLFTLGTGPGQIWFTWKLADPALKRHPSWFWFYLLTSTLFYAGLKNAWNRIAHWKEWRGETTWVVTTRTKAKK